ncbi:leucine-rich repeat domain-containing protein [Clostridium neuense]|uniref:Leucine-rich repeat domain-containing protein n=1 Tax=Clostridium neuense TaxID=1728934 RepID=A0ABW8T994_9CLOT
MKNIKLVFSFLILFAISFCFSDKVYAANFLGGSTCYKTWYINVNKTIDPDTVTSKNVKVFDEKNNEVKVYVDVYQGTSIRIRPGDGGYSLGKTYYINLSSGIKSIYGDNLNLGQYAMNYFVVNQDYQVKIGDSTLEAAIRKAAKKSGDALMQSDLDKISELDISDNYGALKINFNDIQKLHNLNKIKIYNSSFSSLSNIQSLAYNLYGLDSFYSLDLSGNTIGSNINSVLDTFSNLYISNINLSKTNISDISHLSNLRNVNTVDLSGNKISNIYSLGTLNLREANLSSNSITNVSSLGSDPGLIKLDLSNNNITDLSPLNNLFYLDTLNLSNNNKKASAGGYDISPLSSLINLTNLNLSNNNIKVINALENMDKMLTLDLSVNGIQDISGIKNMDVLQNLNLAGNYLINDISVIKNLEHINTIDLSYNKVRNLEPLSQLNNLTDLNLEYNDIVDLTPLEDLTQLQRLKLDNNHITNIYPLINLINLDTLYISGNGNIDTTPIVNLNNLSHKDF